MGNISRAHKLRTITLALAAMFIVTIRVFLLGIQPCKACNSEGTKCPGHANG